MTVEQSVLRVNYAVFLLLAVTACGDPLSRVDRISDVDLAEDTSAQALPSEAELAREGGFFSNLLRRTPEPSDVDLAIASAEQALVMPEESDSSAPQAALEGAAGDPVIADAVVQAPEPAKTGGLLGWLRPSDKTVEAVSDPSREAQTAAMATQVSSEEASEAVEAKIVASNEVAHETVSGTPELVAPKKRRGLFGLVRPAKEKPQEPVRTASLSPEPLADASISPPEPALARGLLGGRNGSSAKQGSAVKDVTYGTVLPYGEVARVCDASRKPMGRKLDKAPTRGKGYALFDSNPDSAGPRTFYVTGFADGCPRQFTASLAVFGAPSMHEQLRYGRPSKQYPYSATDKAYEKVKSSICGVGKRKPCGSKITQVERNTVFISTYERFKSNARWADILIHDGEVLASSIKTP